MFVHSSLKQMCTLTREPCGPLNFEAGWGGGGVILDKLGVLWRYQKRQLFSYNFVAMFLLKFVESIIHIELLARASCLLKFSTRHGSIL